MSGATVRGMLMLLGDDGSADAWQDEDGNAITLEDGSEILLD